MAEILAAEYEERVALDRLACHPRNPRRGNVGRIEKLIEDNGFHGALCVQRSTGFILVGNHRMQAARADGLDALPVLWYDVDDDEALRMLLGDNAGSDDAEYEEAGLASLLSELEASLRGLAGTGWTSAQLEEMLDRLGAQAAPAATGSGDPDDAPDRDTVPSICQLGDTWLLGRHRLIVGDSRDPNVVERTLSGRLADMVFTDPPVDAVDGELAILLRSTLGNCRTWTRPGGSFWVCSPSGPPAAAVFAEVLLELKVWRQTIVWVKDTFVAGRQDYQDRQELLYEGDVPDDAELGASRLGPDLIAVGWKPGAAHHKPGDRQENVWEIARPKGGAALKPVALVERAVRNHTDPGEIVLDVFAGAGSTLIACHRAGRAACLVELDPRYADVICRRWEDYVGLAPRRDGDDAPTSFRRSP